MRRTRHDCTPRSIGWSGAGAGFHLQRWETFPVRFPSAVDPGDAGWHIDVSFGTETSDFMSWRANIHSKGRALLMLFLFPAQGSAMRRRVFGSGRTPTSPGSLRRRGNMG
jgi:hypothetical protein